LKKIETYIIECKNRKKKSKLAQRAVGHQRKKKKKMGQLAICQQIQTTQSTKKRFPPPKKKSHLPGHTINPLGKLWI